MIIQRVVIGIVAIIVIIAIMWLTRNKNNTFSIAKGHNVTITTLQEEYPYWGRGVNAELRCSRPNNTGCDAGYDSRGSLRRLNQVL